MACHQWNCGVASALQIYRHSSRKEVSAGLVILQDIPTVNWSRPPLAHMSWRPGKDIGISDQGRSEAFLPTVSLRLHIMAKGLGESL